MTDQQALITEMMHARNVWLAATNRYRKLTQAYVEGLETNDGSPITFEFGPVTWSLSILHLNAEADWIRMETA